MSPSVSTPPFRTLSLSFFLLICFCLSVLPCFLAFVSWQEQVQTIILENIFINPFCFFVFLSCPVIQIPFSYPFLIACIVQQCHQNFHPSKKTTYQTPSFGEAGGCNKTVIFNNLCFKMWRGFLPHFGRNYADVQKHCKIGISALEVKNKKRQTKYHFEGLLSGPSGGCYLVQVWCNWKMANLAHMIIPQSAFSLNCWNPYSVVFCDIHIWKRHLAQIITPQMAKLAQIITPQLLPLYYSLKIDSSSLKFRVAFDFCVVAFAVLSVTKWTAFPPVFLSWGVCISVKNNLNVWVFLRHAKKGTTSRVFYHNSLFGSV